MKKKSGSRTGRLVGRLFNVKAWVDLERTLETQRYIIGVCKRYLILNKSLSVQPMQDTASFEAAKADLNLTSHDLLVRQKGLLRLTLLMLSIGALLFFYLAYNLFYAHYLAAFITMILWGISLVLAFRYHFWYFQIKHHKLGCTAQQWFREGLLSTKDE